MDLSERKGGMLIIPLAILLLWELCYVGFEMLFPLDSMRIYLAVGFFSFEFAVLFTLSLWLSASLSRKAGLDFLGTLKWLAVFFGIYSLLALAATLMTSDGITEHFVVTLIMFSFLSLTKLLLSLSALLIAHFLPPAGNWDEFILPGMALSVLVLFIALGASLLLGGALAAAFDVQQSPGFSLTKDDCPIGEWMYVRVFGIDFNITVTGKKTYRTREVCYATNQEPGHTYPVRLDVYGYDSDTRCYLTNITNSNGSHTVKEKCSGSWPGYVPSD